MQVAVDSSLLVGILVPNDAWHTQAMALWNRVQQAGHIAVYFDCVVAEVVTVATRRLHEKKLTTEVIPFLDKMDEQVRAESLTWILSDVQRLYSPVLALMRESNGALNFNDALIALACRERNIPAIASFDADFDQIKWLRRLAQPEDLEHS